MVRAPVGVTDPLATETSLVPVIVNFNVCPVGAMAVKVCAQAASEQRIRAKKNKSFFISFIIVCFFGPKLRLCYYTKKKVEPSIYVLTFDSWASTPISIKIRLVNCSTLMYHT